MILAKSIFLNYQKKTDGSIGKNQNKMVLTSMKTDVNDPTSLQATVSKKLSEKDFQEFN